MADVELRVAAMACLVIALAWLIMRWGPIPSRSPEKRARWRALPLRFKLACWFGVTPIYGLCFALVLAGEGAMVVAGLLAGVVAWALHIALEGRVVAWYRANGLF
jgi:hypothetical protein